MTARSCMRAMAAANLIVCVLTTRSPAAQGQSEQPSEGATGEEPDAGTTPADAAAAPDSAREFGAAPTDAAASEGPASATAATETGQPETIDSQVSQPQSVTAAPAPQAQSDAATTRPKGEERAAQPHAAPALHDSTRPNTVDSELGRTTVSGYLQVDYQHRDISLDELSDGSRAPLNEDRFLIASARLRLGHQWAWLGANSEAEFAAPGGAVEPTVLEVHADPFRLPAGAPVEATPPLRVRAGLFIVPFGYENHDLPTERLFFAERALLSQAFIPGRSDVGASVSGRLWSLDWAVAVQNGEPLGVRRFTLRDPNAGKDIAGRLHASGELFGGLSGGCGVSLLHGRGFSPGTPPTKDSFAWRDLDEDGRVLPAELTPIPGSAGRASKNFARWGAGADLQLWTSFASLGRLTLYGEVAVAENLDRAIVPADPALLGRDQRSVGFYVALTQALTEYATVGARFERYEPNADALEQFDGVAVNTRRPFQTLTVAAAANHRLAFARARLLFEYNLQRNSLGRDAAGRPAQLDNDSWRVRAEVTF